MPTQPRFEINGLIDTSRTVMQNLEDITSAAGSWFTFDNLTGQWSVVINKAGTSTRSFNHSNIIGGISIGGTGIREMYNGVRVTYPRTDIRDNQDFVQITLPASELNANEVENILEINYNIVNTQVQSQLLGFRELKQSRVSKTIQFSTDYSSIGVKSGDLIDVTSEPLGLSATMFRVVEVREQDDTELGIVLSITAILYDSSVYDESDLNEYILTTENGIVTAGAIGQPDTPQVTKYEVNSRPRLEIETIVPAGRVEAMEFWMATGNSSSTYSLVGTQRSTNTDLLVEGQEILLDLDNIDAANVYVKTRGVNSTTAGPFSNVSPLISYVPVQTTQAVSESTTLTDNGSLIPIALGLSLLLSKLTSLFGSGDGSKTLPQQLVSNGGMDASAGTTLTVAGSTFTSSMIASTAGYTTATGYDLMTVFNNATIIPFTVASTLKILQVTIQTPAMFYDYEYLDHNNTQRTMTGFVAQPPMGVEIVQGTSPGGTVGDSATIDWQTNTLTFIFYNIPAGDYYVRAAAFPTYSLNMYWPRSLQPSQVGEIFPINYSNPDNNSFKVKLIGTQ